MKKIAIAIGAVAGLFLLLGVAQLLASESGEVLVLETLDAAGQSHQTRLWVVDEAGALWGGPDSGWVQRLLDNPEIRAERADHQAPFLAVPQRDREARERVNTLMRDKYGLADRFIALTMGDTDREGSLPIRLDPR